MPDPALGRVIEWFKTYLLPVGIGIAVLTASILYTSLGLVALALIWIAFIAFVLGYTVLLQHAELRKTKPGDKKGPNTKPTSSYPALEGTEVLHTVLRVDQVHRRATASKRFKEGMKIHVSASSPSRFAIRVLDEDAFGRMEENEDFVALVESSYTWSYRETFTTPDAGKFYFVATVSEDELWANVELNVRVLEEG